MEGDEAVLSELTKIREELVARLAKEPWWKRIVAYLAILSVDDLQRSLQTPPEAQRRELKRTKNWLVFEMKIALSLLVGSTTALLTDGSVSTMLKLGAVVFAFVHLFDHFVIRPFARRFGSRLLQPVQKWIEREFIRLLQPSQEG